MRDQPAGTHICQPTRTALATGGDTTRLRDVDPYHAGGICVGVRFFPARQATKRRWRRRDLATVKRTPPPAAPDFQWTHGRFQTQSLPEMLPAAGRRAARAAPTRTRVCTDAAATAAAARAPRRPRPAGAPAWGGGDLHDL